VSARDDILGRVRRNQPAACAMPVMPSFPAPRGALPERFEAAVKRMGGKVAEPAPGAALHDFVRALFPSGAIFASASPEVVGDRDLATVRKPGDLADVDVGVVRAVFGVAETGSVWLTCREFRVDSLGFLSQHLVVLLDPARIVATMHDAYRDRSQFDARYGVFMTGPSATADIEGVLIHGAQGVRSLTVVPSRTDANATTRT
jgi:L-lactate dehydrogenase complex protein LldG